MKRVFYELVGADDRRYSPYCWRARMALAHKQMKLDEIVPVSLAQKHKVAFSGGRYVPVLVDGEQVVARAWPIAQYLEDTYPHAPSLFGGAQGRGQARFIDTWANGLVEAILPAVLKDISEILDADDRQLFLKEREARHGAPVESLHQEREERVPEIRRWLLPLEATLCRQAFLSGDSPAYSDYAVFSVFQWLRCITRYPFVYEDTALFRWRESMLDLFDGLARTVSGFNDVTRSLANR